ncbi:MAG: TlpA family protein disulfide reductase [Candidatus Binatia bacterium]|nr:TlpA family protein disulfide reductase [Candidatus Binatia bacterium]
MKQRILLPVFVAGALLFALVLVLQSQRRERARFAAPSFQVQTLDGRTVRLEDYRGRVLFLNFWATWCPPCREEMPSMQRVHQRFAQRPFAMLAISQDASPEPVRAFANSLRLSFPIGLDPKGELPERYGVTGFPETFIIDPEGKVVRHVVGPLEWDDPEAIAYLEEVIASAERAPQDGAGRR